MERSQNKTENSDQPVKIGSIEVGLIIMGLSCMGVVALAMIIIHLRAIRKRRQQQQRRQRSFTVSPHVSATLNQSIPGPIPSAPPSYETVIRNPHLYPISPRSSVTSINSIKNQRFRSQSSCSTSGLRHEGRHSFCGAFSQSNCRLQVEDLEVSPPPFPGLINHGFLDLHLQRTYYSDLDTTTRLDLQAPRNRSVSNVYV